ncbi:MAG: DUF2892 domain-containing protein [Bacteroidetes bacterium]|nr:DUF2892 domain-containing protein [Bacteroidota bacterium]
MKTNIGKIDRMLRALVGAGIIGMGFYYQTWWGLVGGIIFLTSVFSFCPIYAPFNWSTKKGRVGS